MAASHSVLSWLGRKLAYAALLAGLGLVGVGLWIFLREPEDFALRQRHAIQALSAEISRLQVAIADADGRMLASRTMISAQQLRADQADKVVRALEELGSGLNWLRTGSDQLKENNERMERMKQMQNGALKRVAELAQDLVHIQWEKDGMELARDRVQAELNTAAAETSPLVHYAREAWNVGGRFVLLAVAVVMLGPILWRSRAR